MSSGDASGAVIHAEQNIAVRQGKVRPQDQSVAQRRLGLGEPALTHQCQPQVVVRIGIGRVAGDGLLSCLLRLSRVPREREHPGQIDPGVSEIWRYADRRTIAVGAFIVAADVAQDVAQVVVSGNALRFQFQRAARRRFCITQSTQFAKDRRAVGMQLRLRRRTGDGRLR